MSQEFKIKDLGNLKYFLGIEVARSKHGIFISQRKYVLDLLNEVGMLGGRPIGTPIEANLKLRISEDGRVDKGRLSRFMKRPGKERVDAINRILRYLKTCPGKGILYKQQESLDVEVYTDSD